MIDKVAAYVLSCDLCAAELHTANGLMWAYGVDAEDEAIDDGWLITGARHVCARCCAIHPPEVVHGTS